MKWLPVLIGASLIFGLAITPASAAPLPPGAIDGDGLMAVLPDHVTYGSTGNTLTFTFTANNDFVSGSQVEIDIPAGWTPPITGPGAGHVSWSAGTCQLLGGPPVAITGSSIFIDIQRCNTNEYFTVTYAGVTPGSIAFSPYTFQTWTDIGPGGGGLTPISAGSPQVTIDPKPLTVSAAGLTPLSRPYDGTTNVSLNIGSPFLVGVVGLDDVSLGTGGATGTFVDRNAGTGKIVTISGLALGGAQAGDYTLIQPTRTANITPRPITINAVTDTKEYDGTVNSSAVPTISVATPLVGGDTAPGLTQDFDTRHAGTNKVLTPTGLVLDGNSGLNYAYTYAPFSPGVITQRPVIVTAVTDSKIYDGTTSSGGTPILSAGTPLAAGDSAPIWTQTFDNANVGTGKLLTPAGAVGDGNGGKNYSYTFVTDPTGAIGLRSVTINADPKTKIIGTADPALTYQASSGSLAAGDILTLTRTAGEALGIYPISIGSFPAGANYSLTYIGANLTIDPAPVFNSTGAYDGWVLESRRDSSMGGTMNASSTTFQLGDDAANRQYKAILSFNTGSLPDNAVITKAVIRIKPSGLPVGLNPFSSLGGLLVDVRKGAFGTPALAPADFQAAPTAAKVGIFGKIPVNGWYSVTLNLAGRGGINTKGVTQFRLYFTKGDNNNLKADYMKFLSGNAASGKPQLIITYTVP